jgi:tRNA(Arg) A34 adenosine deaminase TadA
MDPRLAQSVQLAEQSLNSGGFPVGAIVCVGDVEVGRGASSTEALKDATAHAEVQAIRAGMQRSSGGVLYSSLEPCMMCLAACAWAGIRRVEFACSRCVVDQAYYETGHSAGELSRILNSPIEVVADLSRQDEIVALIRRWEEAYNKSAHTDFALSGRTGG